MKQILVIGALLVCVGHLYSDESLDIVEQNTFGKTHFIKGYPHDEFDQDKKEKPLEVLSASSSGLSKILFSPDDDVRAELMAYITQEKEAITLAMFLLTDTEIAQALVDARKRGVKVEIITDASCLKERSSKINMVCDGGCMVYIYNPAYRKNDVSSIMHHKFVLFANNNGSKWVWTGSYNFTKAAYKVNQENVLLVQNDEIYNRYDQQFGKLKERARHYGKNKVK